MARGGGAVNNRQMSATHHDAMVATLALHPPRTQRVTTAAQLAVIEFTDNVASVMMPATLLPAIRFKNEERQDSPRLAALRAAIARDGYRPTDPIICRIGQKGRWVVVDGGHRLTALREILDRPARRWPILRLFCGAPLGDVYFLLYLTARSYAKADPRIAAAPD